jgi:HK97 family phage portal protein
MKILKFFNRAKPEQIIIPKRNFGYSAGTLVSEDTAMEASAFYRGVIYISSQIAKLPWQIKDNQNKVIENDIYYLLNVSPNIEMTSMFLKLFLVQCALVNGNGYAEIERTIDGRVKALWPLNPKKVEAVRDPEGVLWYRVTQGDTTAKDVYLRPQDIFIVRNLHTKDALQGQGLVAYAMQTLGISLGADKFANSLFANGGMPSGILAHPGKLSDAAYKRLVDTWKENYGGRKTGSTALLEEGVTYSPISHSPDVLQFLESRKFSVVEIARFLGVPPTMLFDSDSAKFNNVEHQNLQVVTDVLDAWARNLESEADMKLLNGRRFGRRTEFDLYAVFRGDMVTRSTYFKNMMQTGSMTPNEIRVKEGLAPYEGGDRFWIAVNNFSPEDRVDEIIDSQIKKNEPIENAQDISEPTQETNPVDEAVALWLKSKITTQD